MTSKQLYHILGLRGYQRVLLFANELETMTSERLL